MRLELEALFDETDADDDVRVVIVTGAGGVLRWRRSVFGRQDLRPERPLGRSAG
jgi:hypothetical protein